MIQTKLAVGASGDEYEREADRMAEQVSRMPEPPLQRARAFGGVRADPAEPSGERLQARRVGVGRTEQVKAPAIVHDVLRSSGEPLRPATRVFMESRFGHDFSRVRVHTDTRAAASAEAIDAHAYTSGSHIVFGASRFSPRSTEGRRLIAHELTHVLQQDRSGTRAVQRFTFGGDGAFSSAQRGKIAKAHKIAVGVAARPKFRRRYNALAKQMAAKTAKAPRHGKFPSHAKYLKALRGMVINNMDKTKVKTLRGELRSESGDPLESQTAGMTVMENGRVYIREFAVAQGIDTLVSLLLHESFHVAGLGMGPLKLYELLMHDFESRSGFPMNMGGADILSVKRRRVGELGEDITFRYRLRHVSQDLRIPSQVQVQVADPHTGRVVSDQQPDATMRPARKDVPTKPGVYTWVWRARNQGFDTSMSFRIVDKTTTSLMGARRFKLNAKCMVGVSTMWCK